jgi:hypothetical protein
VQITEVAHQQVPIISQGKRQGTESTMSHHGEHCPFLNRADHRCSGFFNLNNLEHALEHCFDKYEACPVYATLFTERVERRNQAIGEGRLADIEAGSESGRRLVQVKIASRYSKQPA